MNKTQIRIFDEKKLLTLTKQRIICACFCEVYQIYLWKRWT